MPKTARKPRKIVRKPPPQTQALQERPPARTIKKTDAGVFEVGVTTSLDELLDNLAAITGIRRDEVALRIAIQAADSLQLPKGSDGNTTAIQAIGMLAEMAPQTATESMLAVQMIATHESALMFLRRTTFEGQTVEGVDANVLRATRLMRLHLDQLEAMQKLKGKTGQKVTVEHVHVYQGGQAIVGAVSSGKGEGVNEETADEPHAKRAMRGLQSSKK